MDYKEEQSGEIEALESIYYGDITIISAEPFHKFSIPAKTEEYEPDTNNGLNCNLVFTYNSSYPDVIPNIDIEEAENFMEGYEKDLLSHLLEQAKENVGMVMIFTLVSAAQEWLNIKWDKMKKFREEEESRKQKELEEAERKKFEGTRVSVETFLSWKTKFEEEMGIAKKREAIEREGKKLTGRELFMTDKTLNESDLKFLDEGQTVKVDESLFQDLDDLSLDDEDDDEDNDYDPNGDFSSGSDDADD